MMPQENCIVNTDCVLRVRLREAMEAYRVKSGEKITYQKLAALSGLSVATLQSLAARPDYNTRISTIARLCIALQCNPGDLLEFTEAPNAHTS